MKFNQCLRLFGLIETITTNVLYTIWVSSSFYDFFFIFNYLLIVFASAQAESSRINI